MDKEKVLKWLSLILFCCQNSFVAIAYRYAMTENVSKERYNISVGLFFTELLKMNGAFCLLAAENGSVCAAWREILGWLRNPFSSLLLCVPVLIYALTNSLLHWSAGHVSAAIWQVTFQGKILVTAMLTVMLLRKPMIRSQWLAIGIMAVGIATVQLSKARETKQDTMANKEEQNALAGVLALAFASCCSSFAGIFSEIVFKQVSVFGLTHQRTSLWLQNVQMAVYTLPILVTAFLLGSRQQLATADSATDVMGTVFHGFTKKVWVLVTINAVGGLLVAMVIKYADNILRGFSAAIATVNSILLSRLCFGLNVHFSFVWGSIMVVFASMLYGGIMSLPGNWWNAAPGLCSFSSPITQQELKTSRCYGCVRHAVHVKSCKGPWWSYVRTVRAQRWIFGITVIVPMLMMPFLRDLCATPIHHFHQALDLHEPTF
mmetsp:Transcript_16894/g.32997  ORF Transcript_16894/g.32997 Transcript_16894/m.32997 type:complete len:432 (-) Transcript_16894:57-1352(-)